MASMPQYSAADDEPEQASTGTVMSSAALRELVRNHGDRFLPILSVLREQNWKELVTSRELLEQLSVQGVDWSERTLRLYLAELAEAGLVERHGRRGYRLTVPGLEVMRELSVTRRLGSILYRMEETACQLDFDIATGKGLVSINAYIISRDLVSMLCDDLEAVFRAGLAVGSRVLFVPPGGDILGRQVPDDCIGLGTMCSLTIAGMCQRRGIPTHAAFGGLLYLDNRQPQHFQEMIRYDATTLSPNEIFIRANLTNVARAATVGTGTITASFREVPLAALPALERLRQECMAMGFPGFLLVGRPGQTVLNAPVHEGRCGVVLATGLNPLACLWEHHHQSGRAGRGPGLALDSSRPMVGPAPYESLIPYTEFRRRVATAVAGAAAPAP
jgi:repressor of nif and glnA expression